MRPEPITDLPAFIIELLELTKDSEKERHAIRLAMSAVENLLSHGKFETVNTLLKELPVEELNSPTLLGIMILTKHAINLGESLPNRDEYVLRSEKRMLELLKDHKQVEYLLSTRR